VKTGRNQPCPCGSGKKFKPCWLAGQAVFAYDPSAAERAWMAGFLGMKQE
jgi:hypothetical protein